ncbi:MAG: EscU/YscU/HrcU family type III secretion system export apparatus switch protein [Mariprofundaceae bacterium]
MLRAKKISNHQAVALKWNPRQEQIPKVAAHGSGALADEILRIAKEHNIPIKEDRDLVQILSLLDVGEAIPPEIHSAIAEILAFIYWSNQQYKDVFGDSETLLKDR